MIFPVPKATHTGEKNPKKSVCKAKTEPSRLYSAIL